MKHRFKYGLVLALLASFPAWAGFDEGYAAYKRGDYATALQEFRPLAMQGNARAQNNLGLMYANGEGVPKDAAEAVRWYRKAADQGNAKAQFNLGVSYVNGEGVPENAAEAVRWSRKAADQGHAWAQALLGLMYANGEGVAKDAAEAVRWFRKAADQGNAEAKFNLGVSYKNGEGVPKDAAEAVRWYRKAADQGNAAAQNNLGWMYANGQGVPKDAAEAVRWYRLALQNPELTDALKKIARENINRLEQAAPATPAMTTSAPTIYIPRGPRIFLQAGTFTLEGVARGAGVVDVMINDEVVAQTKDQQAKELAFSYRRDFAVGETVLRVTATNRYGQASTQTVTIIRAAKPR